MQYIIFCCVLYLLVLQQAMSTASFASFLRTSDLEATKPYSGRHLRAPLMGRSLLSSFADDAYSISNETNDVDELAKSNRQRLLLALSNQKRMIVLNFIGDKDVDEKFYGKMLAKRLVAQSSTSEDYKQLMISKLRVNTTIIINRYYHFFSLARQHTVFHLRMLQDNDVSKNLTREYRTYCKEKDAEDMDIDKNYENSNTEMNYRMEAAENFTSNMLRMSINVPLKSLKEKGLNLLHGSTDFI
ncbi:unnamed protein product [Rotaria socialis]|uniref:Cullin family profile domain-containing protein n=3 Tax=Rotaria socialis TaxID=392032 RepID=A0A817YP82_9BILA|nr:unnamed protein product [Rotaria socialis]